MAWQISSNKSKLDMSIGDVNISEKDLSWLSTHPAMKIASLLGSNLNQRHKKLFGQRVEP